MPPVVETSRAAYDLAVKLCDEYDQRKQREKELNVRKPAAQPKKVAEVEGPSRTVTEIDYAKHERTLKELARQEKEEKYARKKQEAAKWCTLDHEHGPNCIRPPMGCSHDHQKEWAIYEKSTEEKVKAADRFREEGNELYRKKNYGLAAVHYRKALLQFDYTFAEGADEERQVESVKLSCLLNLAACKCQQEEWDDVLTQCRLALEIDPRSVKAFYRSGLAHLERDRFELAKDALMSAYEVEPHNPEVLAALRRLKKNMASYKVRRKEVAKEMISGNPEEQEEEATSAPAREPASGPAPSTEQGSTPALAPASDEAASAAAAAVAEPPSGPAVEVAEESTNIVASSASGCEDEAASGLRRRRPATADGDSAAEASTAGEAEAGDDEEAEDADELLNPAHRKLLNRLLVGAACLGAISLGGAMFFLYDAER